MARQADLLAVHEAQSRILRRFTRLDTENVPVDECLNRVLARDVVSPHSVPPFTNSSMDGFAVDAGSSAGATGERPVVFTVMASIAAGSSESPHLDRGQAARIMTGAPLPPGADAVIPFEDVEDRGREIAVTAPVIAGACVRLAGQDLRPGTPALSAGTEIHAPQVGLLAALGLEAVPCVRKPVVAVLSTGDELVSPGHALRPGQIYNSNGPMLATAVIEAGGIACVLDPVGDDPEALRGALHSAAGCDLLLTSGGASVGDFDHVKSVLGAGGEIGFWRVRLRPGKPLIFGALGNIPVLGLPGNPTSAMVTFEVFARPAIRAMLGAPPLRDEIEVVADEHIDNAGSRRTYARVVVRHESGAYHARLAGGQDSAMLLPLALADGLLIIPEDTDSLAPGDRARVILWRQ